MAKVKKNKKFDSLKVRDIDFLHSYTHFGGQTQYDEIIATKISDSSIHFKVEG